MTGTEGESFQAVQTLSERCLLTQVTRSSEDYETSTSRGYHGHRSHGYRYHGCRY
jgi:hypothetical protein